MLRDFCSTTDAGIQWRTESKDRAGGSTWWRTTAAVQVRSAPESDRSHRHDVLYEFVVPELKALSGFLRGEWMNDGEGIGPCLVVFVTEESATSALTSMTHPGGPAVLSKAVYEIEVEA